MNSHPFPSHRVVLWSCAVASTATIGLGNFSLGLHVPLLLLAATGLLLKRGLRVRRHTVALGMIIFVLLAHALITQLTTPCTDMLAKSMLSLGLMVLLVVALNQLAQRASPQSLAGDMKAIVAIVILSLLFDLVRTGFSYESALIRASGIFAEPSHLALSMAPLVVALVRSPRAGDRYWGWGSFVAMTLLSASATLFLMVALCLALSLVAGSRQRISAPLVVRLLAGAAGMALLVVVSPYSDEFMLRVADIAQIDNSANVSSVVYVNGWETATQNLLKTNGLGLGFNRMGCSPRPETDSGAVLDFLDLSDLNFNDGSFTVAKLLSELGLIGLGIWLLMLGQLRRMVRRGRNRRNALPLELNALMVSAVTVITLGALIRGTNYFSGPYLFGLYWLIFGLSNARRPSAARLPSPRSSSRRLDDHSGAGGATYI